MGLMDAPELAAAWAKLHSAEEPTNYVLIG